MKPVFFNNIEFKEIMAKAKELVKESEKHPDEETRKLISSLLKYFDLMHREPIARMLEGIDRSHPELKDTLFQDYTINTLMELYDFQKNEVK
jgi:hypothetical protein